MLKDSFSKLDELAAPGNYVVPPTEKEISYILHFQTVCKRYNIDFAHADPDEKEFVIHMAEKEFYQRRA